MKKALFVFSFLVIVFISPLYAQVMFENVEKNLQGIKTLKGHFRQRTYIKDLEKEQVFEGVFFLKRPDRMKWLYKRGSTDQVYLLGQKLIIYQPSEHQAFVQDGFKVGLSTSPLSVLIGFNEIKRDFYIQGKNDRLLLIPRDKAGIVKKIELETDKKTGFIKTITIYDIYDNTTIIELSGIKTNEPLDDDIFKFNPPDGTVIIKQ